MTLRKLSAVGVGAAAVLALQAAPATAAPATAGTTVTRGIAVGLFHTNLHGISVFTGNGSTIRVRGAYAGLTPGNYYYTVIYANGDCDPAQAFPVGPFRANKQGVARLSRSLPSAVPVGGTMSMSVRMADTAADLDHDGKTGPSDVVAVPGQPSIGLIECDYTPLVASGSAS